MSAALWPDHLLSLEDWDAFPESNTHRREVAEGVLRISPPAASNHQRAVMKLGSQLDRQLPPDLGVLPDVEVLLFAEHPVTVRVPDLVVVPTKVAKTNPKRYDASDVVMVVEVVSPGSVRTDTVMKLEEYAVAGIEQYWIVDLDQPPTITVYRLVDGYFQLHDETTETLRVEIPTALSVDVTALTP